MASNIKKDKTIKLFAVVSIFFCLIAFVIGYSIGSQKIGYQTEKTASVFISSVKDISSLGESVYNDQLYLTQDITISDPNFKIGTEEFPFKGVFDGQGHTIHFTFTNASGVTSLFDYLAPEAIVRNVNFVFDAFTVDGTSFGGIAKINDGTIENCKLTYGSLEISDSGMFSPFVTINRGRISNVVVSGELKGNVPEEKESGIFFGNVCVYNSGTLSGAIVTASYTNLKCTDELNILKGLSKNLGISSIRYSDIENGSTDRVVAMLASEQFTSDKISDIEFANADAIFYNEKIFDMLDFNNKYWKIENQDLNLIITGEVR